MKKNNYFEDFVESMDKDMFRQEELMDKQIQRLEKDISQIEEGLPEVGDKFGDYQEIIEHVADSHPSWKFINISKMGNSISKFYFVSKHGSLVLWIKPCKEGLVITKKNIRKFDNKIVKSVEYFG